ncbi:MAG: hypothetical protein ACRD13_02825 [Terriglobales bacterium]
MTGKTGSISFESATRHAASRLLSVRPRRIEINGVVSPNEMAPGTVIKP